MANFIDLNIPLTLTPDVSNLGIPSKYFKSPFEALIPENSTYNNFQISELLEFQKEGALYLFEDQFVSIYAATRPTKSTTVFAKLKPKKSFQNENARFYTFDILGAESINRQAFIYLPNAFNSVLYGTLVTLNAYEEILSCKDRHIVDTNFHVPENYVFMEEINHFEVGDFFKKLDDFGIKWIEKKFTMLDIEVIKRMHKEVS